MSRRSLKGLASMTRVSRLLLCCHISCLALLIPDASKLVPLRKLLNWMTPDRPSRWYVGVTEQDIVQLVQWRLAHPWRMRGRRCLREGLLCFHFLRLIGVPAELHFGVFAQARSGELAHCWVVVHDRCVTLPPQDAYLLILRHGIVAA